MTFKKGLSLRVPVACVILLIVILTSAFVSFFSFTANRDIVAAGNTFAVTMLMVAVALALVFFALAMLAANKIFTKPLRTWNSRSINELDWHGHPEKQCDIVPEPMPHGKILAVDDMKTNLLVVKSMLEAYELDLEFCGSGMEAIDKIKQGNVYDVIFMDHMMPIMDGIEATKIIRGMGYTHPIVAFSANTLKDHEEMFMSNGFSGFISKPFDKYRLHAFLERFVKNKSA